MNARRKQEPSPTAIYAVIVDLFLVTRTQIAPCVIRQCAWKHMNSEMECQSVANLSHSYLICLFLFWGNILNISFKVNLLKPLKWMQGGSIWRVWGGAYTRAGTTATKLHSICWCSLQAGSTKGGYTKGGSDTSGDSTKGGSTKGASSHLQNTWTFHIISICFYFLFWEIV